MLNKNSIIYFYNKGNEKLNEVLDICTKMDLHLFNCQNIEEVSLVMNKIKPMYIIIDTKISDELILDFANSNKECLIYIVGTNYIACPSQNIYVVESYKKLEIVLSNHYRCYSKNSYMSLKNENLCYTLIHDELNKLSFRPKLIGEKYITDLILDLYYDGSMSSGKCSNSFNKLAIKYNKSIFSIERAIRFSIAKAFNYSQNKELFFDISKSTKIPSVKEVANYILDKIVVNLNAI